MNAPAVAPTILCAAYLMIGQGVPSFTIPWFGGQGHMEYKAVATIEAIDEETRIIRVKVKDAHDHFLYADPDFTGFDQLKVGDTMTFKWKPPVVNEIRGADEAAPKASSEVSARESAASQKRGVTPIPRQSAMVTVKLVEPSVGLLEVDREDGGIMFFVVRKKHLKDLNKGDHVVITYQPGELVSAE